MNYSLICALHSLTDPSSRSLRDAGRGLGILHGQLWATTQTTGDPCNKDPIGLVEWFQFKPSPSKVPIISVNPGFPASSRRAKRVGEDPVAYLIVLQPAQVEPYYVELKTLFGGKTRSGARCCWS